MDKLIKTIIAKLTGRKLVWLLDMDGTETLSIEKVGHFGQRTAERHPFGVRTVTLIEDGSVKNGYYVQKWKYVD